MLQNTRGHEEFIVKLKFLNFLTEKNMELYERFFSQYQYFPKLSCTISYFKLLQEKHALCSKRVLPSHL